MTTATTVLELPTSKHTKKQVIKHTVFYVEGGEKYKLVVAVSHDDECKNGHNTFRITGDLYHQIEHNRYSLEACGCIHEDIGKHLPKLKPFLKWHGVSTATSRHSIANTLYHISERDYHGLLKGEFNSFTYRVMVEKGEEEKLLFSSRIFYTFRNWIHRDEAKEQAETFLQNIKPELDPYIERVGSGSPSEGKERDLEAARSSAVWPEATLEQLSDRDLLQERLPSLLISFKKDVQSLGLIY